MNHRSHAPSPEKIARFTGERERLRDELRRLIRDWARLHEDCPRAGCRRNDRCLGEDNCRNVSNEPPTEEQEQMVRDFLAELARRRRPLYDGTGR